jgi:hypothetical protein
MSEFFSRDDLMVDEHAERNWALFIAILGCAPLIIGILLDPQSLWLS